MWVGTDYSATLPGSVSSDAQVLSYSDYKTVGLQGERNFSFNVEKELKERGAEWTLTSANLPDIGTLFRIYSYGYANGYPMAKVHVCYYA